MKKFLLLVMAALVAFPMTAFAATSEEAMMAELQKQIAELSEELEELSDRLDGRRASLDPRPHRVQRRPALQGAQPALPGCDLQPGHQCRLPGLLREAGSGELRLVYDKLAL